MTHVVRRFDLSPTTRPAPVTRLRLRRFVLPSLRLEGADPSEPRIRPVASPPRNQPSATAQTVRAKVMVEKRPPVERVDGGTVLCDRARIAALSHEVMGVVVIEAIPADEWASAA